ncbi:sensor histidine kinase [Streptomyces sp. NPDC002454]|uniref:sensor histidine kinase n=1 Tax=Streptomyces sp. NPDC002490 TaxID=3154416 RepID=UPI0033283DBE
MSGREPIERPPAASRMRWLLPSAVAAELYPRRGERRFPRRTLRDWIVDFVCFLLAVFVGMLDGASLADHPGSSPPMNAVDQVLGALACGAVWLRRRWPVAIAVALIPVGALSVTAGGAAGVLTFSLAVHRRFAYVAWTTGISLAIAPVHLWLRPTPGLSYPAALAFTLLMTVAVVGWGMFVRSHRELLLSLRERARRAESEAALKAERAQRLAREAIAREMHDVLAHRLTLLSVHAGALEFRPDAPREEVVRAAGVIRESSHEALQDLREIIGVLRAGEGEEAGRPQPTLAGLDTLVDESRAAGAAVHLDNRVADLAAVPVSAGRTAYRIAQEALTNARKHAPGARVSVRVAGAPGTGLTVTVRNPPPSDRVPAVPGSGQGLIGLTERATLAGGRIEHGPDGAGGFRVSAWLPWPS